MKVRKLLCALFAVAIAISATQLDRLSVKAANLDVADSYLLEALELMVDENIETLSYNRQELYGYNHDAIGYGYELNINDKTGFVLMVKRMNYYEVMELYLNKDLPYNNIDGIPIYLTPLCYIDYVNGQYIDIENDIVLDEEQLNYLNEKGFGYKEDEYFQGTGVPGEIVREYINYDSKTIEEDRISGGVPGYFDLNPELTGTCAVQAGAVVVGYYGRYFPELTPGFTVGMPVGSSYYYFNQGSVVQGIINDLYVRMETNVGGAGTTATGFRNGLQSYVQSKGRNLTYTSVASNNTLNYVLYKTQVANLKPTVIFFNTYNVINSPVVDIIDSNNDRIEKSIYPGMHVMIGYGYKKYTYYKNGANFRTDMYLEVYTGVADCAQGFVKLYDSSIIVEAYSINIS